MNKRGLNGLVVEEAPIVCKRFKSCSFDFFQPISVAIDSASFQSRLIVDVSSINSITSALALAKNNKLDMTRSYLGLNDDCWSSPIIKWAKCSKCLFSSPDEQQTIMSGLLQVFVDGGFFARPEAYDAALSAAAQFGTMIEMELLLIMDNKLDVAALRVTNNRAFSIVDALDVKQWNYGHDDVVCRMIAQSSDAYLSTEYCHGPTTKQNVKDVPYNVLKSAVENGRVFAVRMLLKRLPSIAFDVYHSRDKRLAEPLVLSVQKDKSPQTLEIKALIATAEDFMQHYYRGISFVLSNELNSHLLPELILVIDSFLARMPLSPTLILTLPPTDKLV